MTCDYADLDSFVHFDLYESELAGCPRGEEEVKLTAGHTLLVSAIEAENCDACA